jgi:hypothetical protein
MQDPVKLANRLDHRVLVLQLRRASKLIRDLAKLLSVRLG